MTSDGISPDASPGRRHAKRVGLARIAIRGFDGSSRRVHAVPHPHQLARARQ